MSQKVSVILSFYNAERTLERSIRGILDQTYRDIEVILIDDGSTDDTEAVVRSFQTESFPVFYRKKNNGGKHTALNAAHDLIRGKYVLLLDSDDTLTPDAVASIKMEWGKWENDEAVGIVTFLKGSTVNDPNCIVHDWGKPVDIMRYRRTCIHSNDCCEVIRTELFLSLIHISEPTRH